MELETYRSHCPYCGESIEILLDCSVPRQQYIEDCQVCCRPIEIRCEVTDSGEINVELLHENE